MENCKHTQRKIYHFKNTINRCYNTEDSNVTSVKKKIQHTHEINSNSRPSKSKKSRKWHSLNHSNLKYSNCVSNYIGTERLTKQVGFLTKGKISDSISRFEKIVPENVRARANQDLNKILESTNDLQSSLQSTTYKDDSSLRNALSKEGSFTEHCKSHYVLTKKSANLKFRHSKNISKTANSKSVLSPKLDSNVNQSVSSQDELIAPIRTILNKFYPAVSHMNKLIFPGISNQEMLKTDLLNLKKQYHCQKKSPSNSSNYESSQDVQISEEATTDEFLLNPVLTQEQCMPIPKLFHDKFELNPVLTNSSTDSHDLENMFPDAEDSNSSYDKEMQSINSSALSEEIEFASSQQKFISSSEMETKHVSFVSYSPTSPNGSPVWEPVVSPVKFIPDYLPTPKIYFRQKMF